MLRFSEHTVSYGVPGAYHLSLERDRKLILEAGLKPDPRLIFDHVSLRDKNGTPRAILQPAASP
jgi:hypothetical protein